MSVTYNTRAYERIKQTLDDYGQQTDKSVLFIPLDTIGVEDSDLLDLGQLKNLIDADFADRYGQKVWLEAEQDDLLLSFTGFTLANELAAEVAEDAIGVLMSEEVYESDYEMGFILTDALQDYFNEALQEELSKNGIVTADFETEPSPDDDDTILVKVWAIE